MSLATAAAFSVATAAAFGSLAGPAAALAFTRPVTAGTGSVSIRHGIASFAWAAAADSV
ncbi:exported hypothetical protein [Desulfosarcina cetonica]|nr:exported hypothetical protein [Desulfosarcina cetonica]